MLGFVKAAVVLMIVLAAPAFGQGPKAAMPAMENYREWVYLTSGFDMSYDASSMDMSGHHVFDNVFVNPAAYQVFVKTGHWPDQTVLVLEHRKAQGKGSINQSGSYQGPPTDVEVHVKDAAGKWAFFGVSESSPGKLTGALIPQGADCYRCHAAHAAVDTTFVQFYPTLLPVATAKGTLDAVYLKEK